ncbi:MAG: diol dehydratase small subunit [Synergistetes bacterium]|nr:diol dehydratase small subunit [Synergistota bacterium]MDK2870675.1 propanediol dehydratase small subunit [bacterium]
MAKEINEQLLAEVVRKVLQETLSGKSESALPPKPSSGVRVSPQDYPLLFKKPEILRTPTGKRVDEVTLENVLNGKVAFEDLRITPEALEYQAQIAEACGKPQLALNLRRAAELTKIPDERLLEIYNALRPYRSSKEELLSIADELENKYGAKINAAFIREAAEVYEKRRILKGMRPFEL